MKFWRAFTVLCALMLAVLDAILALWTVRWPALPTIPIAVWITAFVIGWICGSTFLTAVYLEERGD
jgi:hypothetical protein